MCSNMSVIEMSFTLHALYVNVSQLKSLVCASEQSVSAVQHVHSSVIDIEKHIVKKM